MKEETTPKMDDVLKESYEEIFGTQKYDKSNLFHTYSGVSKNALQKWEQITSAPLLKRIEEIEKDRDDYKEGYNDLSKIRNRLVAERNLYRDKFEVQVEEISQLQKRISELEG